MSALGGRCVDDSAWNNLHGKACIDYSAYCEAGAFRLGASWAGGEVFNWPERHCCACGKPAAKQATENAQPLFEAHTKSFCRGTDHEVKLKDSAACEDHCNPSKRPCTCFHFVHGECHFTFNYAGLATSTKSSTAWVSSAALLSASKSASASSAGGASCAPVPMPRSPPSFYMYNDAPFAWGPRLAACFLARHGVPPWAMAVNDSTHQLDGTAQPGLDYSLWLSAALAGHRRRVATPEQAHLFIVPAFGSLSEAVGSCEGTTHMHRQAEAAAALRASPWFVKWPQRHVILASSHSADDHDPLGALGSLTVKAGAVALCVDRERCQAGFRKKAIVPPLPLPPLLQPSVRQRQADQACARGGGERRRVSLYWRGRHTKDAAAGALRARLWALKAIPGADIKFVSGGGEISGDSRSWLKAHGWSKDTRLPYSASTYASGVSHADFCLVVQGDAKGTGRALVDAVAAGCVPLLLGSLSPPHGKLLSYDAFSRTIDTAEFLRFPVEATKAHHPRSSTRPCLSSPSYAEHSSPPGKI